MGVEWLSPTPPAKRRPIDALEALQAQTPPARQSVNAGERPAFGADTTTEQPPPARGALDRLTTQGQQQQIPAGSVFSGGPNYLHSFDSGPDTNSPDYPDTNPLPPPPPPPPGGGTSPTGPSGSIPYSGKATQALIDAIFGPGYTLKNGQIIWNGTGGAGALTAPSLAYLDQLVNPLTSGDYRTFFQNLFGGVAANQGRLTDPHYAGVLKAAGFNITPPNASGQISKIQTPSGQWVRVIEGDPRTGGSWTWVPQGPTWSDPSTQQYQDYAQQWLDALRQQWAMWQQYLPGFQQQMGNAQASTENLLNYLRQRAQTLQGPAYTGTQREIFRTHALDPIEADRQTAQKRALDRISRGGYLPTSGIAIDLQNQIDQPFDRERNQTQNQLAYSEIAQEQANQNQAMQLLALIPNVQRAASMGDVGFLQQLTSAMNQPQAMGLPLSNLIYQLPRTAMQDAQGVLNQGTSPQSLLQDLMALFGVNQQQQQQGNQWWEQFGSLLPYLMQAGR